MAPAAILLPGNLYFPFSNSELSPSHLSRGSSVSSSSSSLFSSLSSSLSTSLSTSPSTSLSTSLSTSPSTSLSFAIRVTPFTPFTSPLLKKKNFFFPRVSKASPIFLSSLIFESSKFLETGQNENSDKTLTSIRGISEGEGLLEKDLKEDLERDLNQNPGKTLISMGGVSGKNLLKGGLKRNLEGVSEGKDNLRGDLEENLEGGNLEGNLEGDFEKDFEGDLKTLWDKFEWKKVTDESVSVILEKLFSLNPEKKVNSRAIANISHLISIGLSQDEVLKAVKNLPAVVNYSPEETKLRIYEKALFFGRHGVTQSEYCKGLSRGARFITASMEQLDSVVNFLVGEVGITRLGKILKETPTLFCTPTPSLRSKVVFLSTIGIRDVLKCVDRNPQCLQLSSESMRLKFFTIQKIIGDYPVQDLIEKMPKLLSRKAETVSDSFEGLVEAFGKDPMQRTIIKAPQVLFVSRKNLIRVLQFVEETMKRDRDEVLRAPAVLTYSVDKRLMPRYEACISVGKEHLSLSRMFVLSPKQFDVCFGTSLYGDVSTYNEEDERELL